MSTKEMAYLAPKCLKSVGYRSVVQKLQAVEMRALAWKQGYNVIAEMIISIFGCV